MYRNIPNMQIHPHTESIQWLSEIKTRLAAQGHRDIAGETEMFKCGIGAMAEGYGKFARHH